MSHQTRRATRIARVAMAWGLALGLEARGADSTASIDLMYRPERHLLTRVELHAEGRTVSGWVVVDTGASFALGVSKDTATRLRASNATITFVGSPMVAKEVPVSLFDDQRVAKVAARSGKDLGDQPLLGLIGFPLLRHHLVTFDLEQKQIHFRPLSSVQRTWRADPPLAEVTYLDQANECFCPVTINRTAKGYLQVDTGIAFGTLLEPALAASLTSFEVGGAELVKIVQTEELMPAPFGRGNPFGVKSLYGLMGLNLLRHLTMTIDPVAKKLYFEKTSSGLVLAAGAPWMGIRFGVAEGGEGKVVVVRVTQDGPADHAGLREGDRIDRIDGRPVGKLEEAQAAVKAHKPGDRLVFDVARDGAPLALTATVGSVKP